MPASLEFVVDLMQLGPHPLWDCDALELETPAFGRRADVREAKKRKRLRPPDAALVPVLGGVPSELDQARLLRVQLQRELRKPLPKIAKEPLGVLTMPALFESHRLARA